MNTNSSTYLTEVELDAVVGGRCSDAQLLANIYHTTALALGMLGNPVGAIFFEGAAMGAKTAGGCGT